MFDFRIKNFRTKTVSPLIASILLIVIAVVLIGLLLGWGTDFLTERTKETEDLFSTSNLTGFVTSQGVSGNFVTLANSHPSEDANIIGYQIIPSLDHLSFDSLNDKIYSLEEPIYLASNSVNHFRIDCFPENRFQVNLITEDNKYIRINMIQNNLMKIDSFRCGLVGWWKFDEGEGMIVQDSSFYENHGDLLPENKPPIWKESRQNNKYALEFDGDNNYVETSFFPGANLLDQKFTWVFWNKFYSFGSNEGSHGSGDTPRMYVQTNNNSGSFRTAIGDSFWNSFTIGLENLNKWLFFTIVFDDGVVYTYMNGNLKNIHTNVIFSGESNHDLSFGRGFDNGRYLDGLSDGHRIYNRVLTEDEIKELFDLEKA